MRSFLRHLEASRLVAALALVGVVASCGGSTPASPTPTVVETPIRNAVAIISIDGLRPDAIQVAPATNLLALASDGAYSWKAQTILPSNTLPSHVSMLTGFLPAAHGVTWDDYLPARGRIQVPTLFNAARTAGRRTAILAGKDKFTTLFDAGGCDTWQLSGSGDSDLAALASVQEARGIDLLFVHLPDVDLTGHSTRWMSDSYLAAVRRADAAVGRILASLPEYATVIVTADHGGLPGGHGSADPVDTTIPWIIRGPDVVHGRELTSPIRTVDTAATAAYILGITLAPGAVGQPVYDAFR